MLQIESCKGFFAWRFKLFSSYFEGEAEKEIKLF